MHIVPVGIIAEDMRKVSRSQVVYCRAEGYLRGVVDDGCRAAESPLHMAANTIHPQKIATERGVAIITFRGTTTYHRGRAQPHAQIVLASMHGMAVIASTSLDHGLSRECRKKKKRYSYDDKKKAWRLNTLHLLKLLHSQKVDDRKSEVSGCG